MTNSMKLSGFEYVKEGALLLFSITALFHSKHILKSFILLNICNLVCLPIVSLKTLDSEVNKSSPLPNGSTFRAVLLAKVNLGLLTISFLWVSSPGFLFGIILEQRTFYSASAKIEYTAWDNVSWYTQFFSIVTNEMFIHFIWLYD